MNANFKFLVIGFYFISNLCYSQNSQNNIDVIARNFDKMLENYSSNSIYLQTSKDIYETGENLWFKGYSLDAQSFMPFKNDKTLYVQLINDETKQVVLQEKYEIENGFINGHLYIRDSIKTGQYSLAAYSKHSFFLNQEIFYALKKISIIKNIKEKVETDLIKSDSISQFSLYPEGGYLISDIKNRLAFKALSRQGVPIDFSGTLFENNLPLIDFKSLHAGMGSFSFTPKKLNNYYIKLSGSHKKYKLPEIKTLGKTLHLVRNTKDFIRFKISQNKSTKLENVYLRLQIRGVIYSIASAKLKEEIIIKLPLKDVPQGIAEVTLLNSDLEPIAERLVYIKLNQKLYINTVLNKEKYKTREKVILKIKTTNEKGNPVIGHLGLSVYDKIYKKESETKNILTHYQLSTQLKGKIYNPNYYFNKDNGNRVQALDLLMLTQGWRRYNWNEKNLKRKKQTNKTILFESIMGKVRLKYNSRKAKKGGHKMVVAFTSDSIKSKDFIMTDSIGFFNINYKHLKMAQQRYLYIKPLTTEKPKYIIDIKDNIFDIINKNRKTILTNYPNYKLKKEPLSKVSPYLLLYDRNKLDEVVVVANRKNVFRDKYLGTLDSIAKLNFDYVCPNRILNCIYHKSFSNKPVEGKEYILDNRKDENDRLIKEYIIYQLKNYTEEELLKKFNLKMLKGYYGIKEFYKPIYDKETNNSFIPDYRNTLVWQTDIITNVKGEASVEFYCSDINSFFLGTIEGVSSTGLLGTKDFNFYVSKQ